MKPLRWLLSYVVTNHLVNQAKTRITNRLSSSYAAFSNTKMNEIHLIRGMARVASYFFFRGKEVSLKIIFPRKVVDTKILYRLSSMDFKMEQPRLEVDLKTSPRIQSENQITSSTTFRLI